MEKRFENFTYLILQINRSIQRIKNMEMTEFGLKGIHAMCLFYLKQYPGALSQAELSKLCAEDKASICRALSELSDRGLLLDTQCEQMKKYNAKLKLTDRGYAIAEQVDQKVGRILDIGGAGLDEEERRMMYKGLEQVNTNLENYVHAGRNRDFFE